MEINTEVKLVTGDMYNYFLHHAYTSVNGLISIVAGILLLVLAAVNYISPGTVGSADSMYTMIYFIFGLIFLGYLPFNLYTKAKQQILLNPMFKKPLTYRFGEEGIWIMQEDQENLTPWQDLFKVTETKRSIFIYAAKNRAYILPKRLLGEQQDLIRKTVRDHADAGIIKFK